MNFEHIAHCIPFVSLVTEKRSVARTPRPLITGLIEKAIIAIVAAGLAIWGSDIKQNEEITALKTMFNEHIITMTRANEQQVLLITDLRNDIKQMQKDLYVPRSKELENRFDRKH